MRGPIRALAIGKQALAGKPKESAGKLAKREQARDARKEVGSSSLRMRGSSGRKLSQSSRGSQWELKLQEMISCLPLGVLCATSLSESSETPAKTPRPQSGGLDDVISSRRHPCVWLRACLRQLACQWLAPFRPQSSPHLAHPPTIFPAPRFETVSIDLILPRCSVTSRPSIKH